MYVQCGCMTAIFHINLYYKYFWNWNTLFVNNVLIIYVEPVLIFGYAIVDSPFAIKSSLFYHNIQNVQKEIAKDNSVT